MELYYNVAMETVPLGEWSPTVRPQHPDALGGIVGVHGKL